MGSAVSREFVRQHQSQQVKVPKTDHFFNHHEADMVKAVKNFMDSVR